MLTAKSLAISVIVLLMLSVSAHAGQTNNPANASSITGTLPVIHGGTGITNSANNVLARKNYSDAPIFPAVYAFPPTVTWTSGGTPIANNQTATYDFKPYSGLTSGSANNGTNVLTFAVNKTLYFQVGSPVSHIVAPSCIPPGTTVTATTSTTVTLSQNLTCTVNNAERIAFGNPTIAFLGGPQGTLNVASNTPVTLNAGNYAWTAPPFAVEFDYYGTQFDLFYYDTASAPEFWIWVDGQPITTAPTAPTGITPSAGSYFRTVVTFNNPGDSAIRWRRIRVYFKYADFRFLEYGPTESLSYPQTAYPKVAWYGDSWIEGVDTAHYGADILLNIAQMSTNLLGFGVPLVAGQGGTGYVNTGGGGSKAAYIDTNRLARLISYNPDIVIISGSLNDNGQSAGTITANAATVYSTIKASLPLARIFVIGPPSRGSASDTANDYANRDAVKSAASAAKLTFIDPLAENWIVGTGKYGATTGFGNADLTLGSDGVHLQQPGWELYARRISSAIANNY